MRKITKTLLSLSIALSTVMAASSKLEGQNVDLNDKLVAYYDFENVNDKTVPNKVDSTLDGKLIGSNVSIANTKFGKSLHFANGEDGRMEIEQAINATKQPFTLSLWYKYDTSFNRGGKKTVLLQQDGQGRSLLLLKGDNKYSSFINGQDVDSDKSVDIQKWQHVTYVYNPTTKQISYYINGELDSVKNAGNGTVDSLTKLIVGRHKNGGNDPLSMRGDIDEIRYYHKAVTAAEARAIYEDKAGVILFDELISVLDEARQLVATDKLPDDHEITINLKSRITEAEKLTSNSAMIDIQKMIMSLEQAIQNYRQAIAIDLNIDLNQIEREIDDSIFGINHRYAFNGYGSFDSEAMKIKDEFADLYKASNFGSLRYPGGTISNLFQWKGTIGDLSLRTKQIHGFYNNPNQHGITPSFGINELGTFAQDVGSEIVYVYGFGRGSAQDASDLIEYLNAPVGLNPNGGVDWALIRAKNGHEEPFNVRYFEIGNENNQGGTDGTTSQQYWMQFVDGGAEKAYVDGGLVKINRQFAVLKDDWNKSASDSTGEVNQKRYMRYANPNPMTGENGTELVNDFKAVEEGSVHVFVDGQEWTCVDSFANQTSDAKVYTIDYRDGSFTFGDGVHGMIPPKGKEIRVSYQVQRDGFVAVSKAMKETMAKIDATKECNVYSSYETKGFIDRMANQQDYYDGLTIHPYSGTPQGGSNNAELFYDSAMKLAEDSGIKHVENYVKMLPEGKVPVISEYGIFRSTDSLVRSQTHAVYIAKVLMEYVRLGSPYIQKHCLVDWYSSGADSLGPTQQAVIQAVPQEGADMQTGEGNFKFFATPSARIFEMINSSFGNEIIKTEFDEVIKLDNGVNAYSSLASKDSDGNVYVAIVNVDRNSTRKMKLNFNGFDATNKHVEIQTLAGTSFTDENSLENPDKVAIEKDSFVNERESVEVTLKPHSFTIVKIAAQSLVDKTVLINELAEIAKLDPADYSTTSYANLQKAVSVANAIVDKKDATQEEVDEALANLQAARKALESANPQIVNKIALQIAVDLADKITDKDLENVVPAVVTEFKAALSEANEVYNNASATQEQVNNAFDRLASAMQKLEFYKGDKTKLIEATKEANSKQEEDYTADSWKALQQALQEANKVLVDENAMQKEVDDAANKLQEALDNLVTAVDKSLLQAFVEYVSGLDSNKYTEATWKTFETEFNEANAVLKDANTTQEQVDNAYNQLVKAYLDLRLIPDKSLLEELINQAERLNVANYTKASYEAMKTALEEAKGVLKDANATQKEVDNAKATLEKAINSLEATTTTSVNNGDNTSVKTGDESLAGMLAGVTLLSVAGYVVLRRKEN